MDASEAEVLHRTDQRAVLHPFSSLRLQAQRDVLLIRSAQGIHLTDDRGRRFVDAGSGLWCVNVGYGREELVQAAAVQMRAAAFVHSFSNFTHEPLVRLSEKLLSIVPGNMARVLYANSGSEANDTQVKLVWRYNNLLGRPAKKKIIARRGSYHGSTTVAASLTGLPVLHRQFDLPIDRILHTEPPEYHRRPEGYDDPEAYSKHLAAKLDELILAEGPETVAAFIAEPIMGSAGVILPPAGYFREIGKVLERYDVLLIADEVITGFGRTGDWFASPAHDMRPDLVTLAKGLTSGYLPMSTCVISKRVADVLYDETTEDGFFGHGFTSSGHPTAAAVALENIAILEREDLVRNARRVGEHLQQRLRALADRHDVIGDVRGRGLMIGVEFDEDRARRRPFADHVAASSALSAACLAEGLIVRGGQARVVAAFAPPLTLSVAQADDIVDRFDRALVRFRYAVRH